VYGRGRSSILFGELKTYKNKNTQRGSCGVGEFYWFCPPPLPHTQILQKRKEE
jgi:hypothetical protein